jgi:hypothetical protein
MAMEDWKERYDEAQREIQRLREQLENFQNMLQSEVVKEGSEGSSGGVDVTGTEFANFDWWSSWGASGESGSEASGATEDWWQQTKQSLQSSEEERTTKKKKGRSELETLREELERLRMYLYMQQLNQTVESTIQDFLKNNPSLRTFEDWLRSKAAVKVQAWASQHPKDAVRLDKVAEALRAILNDCAKEIQVALQQGGSNTASSQVGTASSTLAAVPATPSTGVVTASTPAEANVGALIYQSDNLEIRDVPDEVLDELRRKAAQEYIRDRVAFDQKRKLGQQYLQQIQQLLKKEQG